jgi:hypothetical protein
MRNTLPSPIYLYGGHKIPSFLLEAQLLGTYCPTVLFCKKKKEKHR